MLKAQYKLLIIITAIIIIIIIIIINYFVIILVLFYFCHRVAAVWQTELFINSTTRLFQLNVAQDCILQLV